MDTDLLRNNVKIPFISLAFNMAGGRRFFPSFQSKFMQSLHYGKGQTLLALEMDYRNTALHSGS